jgi:hypothetical protein
MFSKSILAIAAVLACSAYGQSLNHKIDLPKDSPVGLLSADFGNSNVIARGGANQIEVNASLSLRNSSQKRIRARHADVLRTGWRSRWKGSVAVHSGCCSRRNFSISASDSAGEAFGRQNSRCRVKLDEFCSTASFYGGYTAPSAP